MSGAVDEVTTRLVSAIMASADVIALCGNPVRILSEVPLNETFPYITSATPQDIPEYGEELDLCELYIGFDVWGRNGPEEVSNVCAAIRGVLHLVNPFDTANWSIITLVHKATNGPFKDSDGLTWHAQITFRAFAEAH